MERTGTQRGTALEVHNGADAAEAHFLPPQQGRLRDSGGLHTPCKGPYKTLWETRHVTLNIRWLLMNPQRRHTKSLQGKHHCRLDSLGGLCWRRGDECQSQAGARQETDLSSQLRTSTRGAACRRVCGAHTAGAGTEAAGLAAMVGVIRAVETGQGWATRVAPSRQGHGCQSRNT